LWVFVRGYFTTSNNWNRFFAYFTSKNSYHPIKQGLSLFLGVKNWGYSKAPSKNLPSALTRDTRKPGCLPRGQGRFKCDAVVMAKGRISAFLMPSLFNPYCLPTFAKRLHRT